MGQTKHFKVKTSVFRVMCTLSTPLGFLAKSLFFQMGVGVENKGSSSWQTVAMGEKGVSWAVFARALGILKGHLVYSFPE